MLPEQQLRKGLDLLKNPPLSLLKRSWWDHVPMVITLVLFGQILAWVPVYWQQTLCLLGFWGAGWLGLWVADGKRPRLQRDWNFWFLLLAYSPGLLLIAATLCLFARCRLKTGYQHIINAHHARASTPSLALPGPFKPYPVPGVVVGSLAPVGVSAHQEMVWKKAMTPGYEAVLALLARHDPTAVLVTSEEGSVLIDQNGNVINAVWTRKNRSYAASKGCRPTC